MPIVRKPGSPDAQVWARVKCADDTASGLGADGQRLRLLSRGAARGSFQGVLDQSATRRHRNGCHAYGCKTQTPFTFSEADIAEIAAVMARVKRDDSPAEERRAIAYAIAWMERRVAPSVGTATDRPSMDFLGSGDESQQDCVDEALCRSWQPKPRLQAPATSVISSG